MSFANNGAFNSLDEVASLKRKCSCPNEDGCRSNKKVALQLFPTQKQLMPLHDPSQFSGLNHHQNGGLDQISAPTNHDNNVQFPSEAKEDPFEKLFKSQYEKLRETSEQYLKSKYINLVRQVEERASRMRQEKDMDMAQMRRMITFLEEKLASDRAHVQQLNEVINNKNTECDNIMRKNIQLEDEVSHYKSQAEFWKEKAESVQEMLWNTTASPRRQAPCDEVEGGGSCN